MNFTYLVESGKYSLDDLNNHDKAFIEGMDRAIDELRTFYDNAIMGDEMDLDSNTLDRIKKEFSHSILKDLETWLTATKNELIVRCATEVMNNE